VLYEGLNGRTRREKVENKCTWYGTRSRMDMWREMIMIMIMIMDEANDNENDHGWDQVCKGRNMRRGLRWATPSTESNVEENTGR
jgi:hypothetical protein